MTGCSYFKKSFRCVNPIFSILSNSEKLFSLNNFVSGLKSKQKWYRKNLQSQRLSDGHYRVPYRHFIGSKLLKWFGHLQNAKLQPAAKNNPT